MLGNLEGPPRGEAWASVLGASERALEDGQTPCDSLDTGFPVGGEQEQESVRLLQTESEAMGKDNPGCQDWLGLRKEQSGGLPLPARLPPL